MAAASNTVIGVVATDADLTKAQCQRLAMAAHDGIARAVRPSHLMVDGDVLFSLATAQAGPARRPDREPPARRERRGGLARDRLRHARGHLDGLADLVPRPRRTRLAVTLPPDDLEPFELAYPGPLRDRLVAAVLSGAKTSTSSLLVEYGRPGDDPLPVVGQRYRLVDSDLQTVGVVETVEVRMVPISEIDLVFAQDEGEGYESVEAWRRSHEGFWREHVPGVSIDDATVVVAERFRLVERLDPPGPG